MKTKTTPKNAHAQDLSGYPAHRARLSLGYTLRELARETRIPFATISRIERGLQVPTLEHALTLADALGVVPLALYVAPISRASR